MILNFKTTIFSAITLTAVLFLVIPSPAKGGVNLRGVFQAIRVAERADRSVDSAAYYDKLKKDKRPLTKKEKSIQRAKYKKYIAKSDAKRKTFYGWIKIIVASTAILYVGLKLYKGRQRKRKTKK